MKFSFHQILATCLLLAAGFAMGNEAPPATTALRVEMTGLQHVDGKLYIAVYDSEDTWLGDDTVLEQKVVIADSREGELVTVELQLAPGEYALSIFYDRNENGELDTNFIGIPKEPVALSNNAKAKFGPPKYKNAVFILGVDPLTQRIDMQEI